MFSASDKNSLDRTIMFFSDIAGYMRCQPCGAVFALLPKNEEDSKLVDQSLMYNIDFRQNPEQFYGVISSPENIESLKEWTRNAGLPEDKVYTFEQFVHLAKVHSDYLDHQAEFMGQFNNGGSEQMHYGQTQELTQDLLNNNQKNIDYDDGR